MNQRHLIIPAAFAVAVAALLLIPRDTVHSQAAAALDETAASFRVEFGVADAEPRSWDGTLAASGGEVTALRNWRPRPGDAVAGTTSWKLATRQGLNFVKRAWEVPFAEPQRPYLLTTGLVVDVKGGSGTRVKIDTPQGSFEVSPFDLRVGQPQPVLDGKAYGRACRARAAGLQCGIAK